MDDDSIKLKLLIRNFLDSTSSSYSVIDDRRFREMLLFLRPDISLPSSMDMISERWQKNEEERQLYQVDSFPLLPEPAEAPETSMTVLQFIQSQQKTIAPLEVDYYKEEVKPENIIEEPVLESMEMKVEIEEAAQLAAEANSMESLQIALYQGINENADRCVVCRQPMNFIRKRKLSVRHGYLIKSVCILNDMYSIDDAKEKDARFFCCISHLHGMYNLVLSCLQIKNLLDIQPTNGRIATAFEIVNELKEFRFARRQSSTLNSRYTFCDSIQSFIDRYGPQYRCGNNFRWPTSTSPKDLQES